MAILHHWGAQIVHNSFEFPFLLSSCIKVSKTGTPCIHRIPRVPLPLFAKYMITIKSFNPSVSNALPKCRAVAPFLFPSQYHCVVWESALPQKVLLCEPCF